MYARSYLFTAFLGATLCGAWLGCSADESGERSTLKAGGDGASTSTGGSILGGGGSNTGTGTGGGTSILGNGAETAGGSGGGVPDCSPTMAVTYRDFKGATEPGGHPDFENSDTGLNDIGCEMVAPSIGADRKPVFQSGPGLKKRVVQSDAFVRCEPWNGWNPTNPVANATSFKPWYNDDPAYNMTIEAQLQLAETAPGSGQFVFDSATFFPLDNQGFGNTPGFPHNYSFTTEIHVKFGYAPGQGQKFTFRGDDDLWIFVNGKLALDLGGKHMPISASIDFDAQAAQLGITRGGTFSMEVFHAERKATGSNFRIETNINCFEPDPIVIVK